MTDRGHEELNLLNKKLDELLDRYNDLRLKNSDLKTENEKLRQQLHLSDERIKTLETSYERVKLSGALLGSGENAVEARKKINELVREIDRCVTLLNR